MEQVFYKGVLESSLRPGFIPGSITTDLREASMWAERIASRKSKGAARHVQHGKSVVIRMIIDTAAFLDCKEFQRAGVAEHERGNCWMNAVRSKAQVNVPVSFTVVS